MKELKEIRINETNIQLKDNLVKGSILPEKIAELTRTVTIQGNTTVEGPIYAHKLEIQQGDADLQGSIFTHLELYVNSDAIQHLCAEAAFSIFIDMLVSISVRRQRSACEWRCLSVPLCSGGGLHVNGDGCQHLCAEAALCM